LKKLKKEEEGEEDHVVECVVVGWLGHHLC